MKYGTGFSMADLQYPLLRANTKLPQTARRQIHTINLFYTELYDGNIIIIPTCVYL